MSATTPDASPVVIEAAITPLRKGAPLQTTEQLIGEALDSLAAGASVIHHHHDFRLDAAEAIEQVVAVERAVLDAYPDAFLYNDYLRGDAIWEKNAHLQPLANAGSLRMIALDPGLTQFAFPDDDGLPTRHVQGGATYPEATEVVEFARRTGTPLSVGIYDPTNLRWAVAFARAGRFPAGTMIKLYFGGEYAMGGDRAPTIGFGLYPTKASLDIYLSMLEGTELPWIVSIQGGALLDSPIARYALELGGHLRVGVEDMAGAREWSNRETVERAAALAAEVGRPVARGAQARAVLGAGAPSRGTAIVG